MGFFAGFAEPLEERQVGLCGTYVEPPGVCPCGTVKGVSIPLVGVCGSAELVERARVLLCWALPIRLLRALRSQDI